MMRYVFRGMVTLTRIKLLSVVILTTAVVVLLIRGVIRSQDQGISKWTEGGSTDDSVQNQSAAVGLPRPGEAGTLAAGSRQPKEAHHLFFLKVHKAASTTMLNVIYRFALDRGLLVLLPKPRMRNVLHESSKNWVPNAAPLPPGAMHFDVLCNHLIFEENSVRKALPQDAVFVGIVRNPLDMFVSAFWYYRERNREPYLLKVPGRRPVSEYLKNPRKWEAAAGKKSFTHNRMSIDFGMDTSRMHDAAYVRSYLHYLNSTFHLVMVSDRFDESVLLFKRLLGWGVQDVLYLPNNVRHSSPAAATLDQHNFTVQERRVHRKFNLADYQLYEHFLGVLDDKVRARGEEFQKEVAAFRALLTSVKDYCLTKGPGYSQEPVKIMAEYWREQVLMTSDTCHLMTMGEMKFVERMRKANAEVARLRAQGL